MASQPGATCNPNYNTWQIGSQLCGSRTDAYIGNEAPTRSSIKATQATSLLPRIRPLRTGRGLWDVQLT